MAGRIEYAPRIGLQCDCALKNKIKIKKKKKQRKTSSNEGPPPTTGKSPDFGIG